MHDKSLFRLVPVQERPVRIDRLPPRLLEDDASAKFAKERLVQFLLLHPHPGYPLLRILPHLLTARFSPLLLHLTVMVAKAVQGIEVLLRLLPPLLWKARRL